MTIWLNLPPPTPHMQWRSKGRATVGTRPGAQALGAH